MSNSGKGFSAQRWRGFSIVEMIVALCLILIGFFTFFSVFSTGAHHAVMTQNRAAASILAQTCMDEMRAHTFGAPRPSQWDEPTERPVRLVIKDRETAVVFHKKIEFETGAFVGKGIGNRDKATITISWRELSGSNQAVGAPTGFADDNKILIVEVPLWR